jgi:pantoate--beta-alanine ligase
VKRVRTRAELSAAVAALRDAGLRTALVPTMGALHEGHLSLVDLARQHADRVIVSVFVNPLQFGPAEDFERYPRDLERDAAMAETRGTDVLFTPETAELYPYGEPGVYVTAPALAERLCGAHRPGHFQGVLTVVAKLLNLASPAVAVFGEKDFQQLALIRRMVRDLDFRVEIVGAPTVREDDGLARSSRNVYLSAEGRRDAVLIPAALRAAQHAFAAGERSAERLVAAARDVLVQGKLLRVQYVELVAADSLDPVSTARPGDVLALAAFVGSTRLIDNHALA